MLNVFCFLPCFKVAAIREGMSMIVPVPLLSLCSSSLMEKLVCGSEVLDIQMLKLIAKYDHYYCTTFSV